MSIEKRINTITELAVRNELPYLEVMQIYTKASCKIYTREVKKGRKFLMYDPKLEEEVFKLTERYFDIKKIRDLKRDFPYCMKEQTGNKQQ